MNATQSTVEPKRRDSSNRQPDRDPLTLRHSSGSLTFMPPQPSWLREPLLHFLVLGAALFLIFALLGDRAVNRNDRIVVSTEQVEALATVFARTWQRSPTAQELSGLVEDHIREEIYYREALAMGLDREDTIVRRRMRQKLEFLTDDVAAIADPTDEQLQGYLEEHREAFRAPARFSFHQVYLNRDRRGDAAASDAQRALSRLRAAGAEVDWSALGDTILLPAGYDLASEVEVDRQFGVGFAARLAELPVGGWEGPVESGYGLHLVRIRERQEAEDRALGQVREAVERDWRAQRRTETADAFYQGLRGRYSIDIEWPGPGDGADEAQADR